MRILLLLSVLSLFSAQQLAGQERNALQAKVVRENNGKPVPYVNVVNRSLGKGTAANSDGEFLIPVQLGDTLWFSAIGYSSLQIVLDEGKMLLESFKMKALQYELGEITVYGYNFEKTEIRKPRAARQGIPLAGVKSSRSSFSQYQPTFQNVISLLYSEFSRRERIKRESWDFVGRLEMLKILDTLFHDPTVTSLIPFKGQELEMFKRYCILEPDFFISGNDYINLLALKRKVEVYRFYQDRNSR